uniref:Uncharacterized protein n=1 Tax=Ciona savignyi TaxID=51511 RepID=H2YZR5_CIOSA
YATFQKQGFLLPSIVSEIVLLILLAAITKLFIIPTVKRYNLGLKYSKQLSCPPTHWLWGHLSRYPLNHEGVLQRMRDTAQYAATFVCWLGPFKYWLEFQHPTSCAVLANSSAPKAPMLYEYLRPWIGDGLLLSSGNKWKRNRRLLTPAFHFEILKPYTQIFNKTSTAMLNKWSKHAGQSYDIYGDVSNMAFSAMMQCTMSTELESNQEEGEDNYSIIFDLLTEIIIKRINFPLLMVDWIFNLTPSGRRFWKLVDFVHKTSEALNQRNKSDNLEPLNITGVSQFKKRGTKHLDFLDILLQTRDEDGNGLTQQEIRDEVDTFLFGGHDTIASGLSWCLYNLATHPDYQERCRQELVDVVGDNELIEWDDLPKLNYLAMCIKESLRLFPPAFGVGRVLNEDLTIKDKYATCQNVTAVAGTTALLQITALHRNPHVWENPEVYDPERFSADNMKGRHPMAFLSFSAGPR